MVVIHRANGKLASTLRAVTKDVAVGLPQKGGRKGLSSPPVSDADIVKWNMTISEHMRNGRCASARILFDNMPRRSTVSWNAMISGYASNGMIELAREMFERVPKRDLVTWNVMIAGHIRNRNLRSARRLFDEMPERDVVSWNTLISGYVQNGNINDARELFDRMPVRNSISWNAILTGYVQNGRIELARELFDANSDWDTVAWNALMGGYVHKGRLDEARKLFDRIPERDAVSWNTMISGYAQNGELSEAEKLFRNAPVLDVFSWTAMASGYAQNGRLVDAQRVFDEMPERNEVSWNALIAGYAQSRQMDKAQELFEEMACRNISSWNTMITGHAQNGDVDVARQIFDRMPQRDSISWSGMIAGYAQNGHGEEALQLFIEMRCNGERSNRSTFTCALSTCADLAAVECGRQLHAILVKVGYEMGSFVGNALLAMYCKCGSIDEAYGVFERMQERDAVTWNTMIAGYARHGFGLEALKVFEMMKMTNIKPDDVTMIGVLSACSHAGFVDKGMNYFYTMNAEYGIATAPQHYTCMIDLLGRAGRLEEAQELLKNMPFEPDATMWGALLGASRIHGDTRLGEIAAERIFQMEPDNAGMYVLLSNLYAIDGRWRDVDRLRDMMRERGVKKVPGFSWIEVKNKVHTFSVGDTMHPEKERIYAFLDELDLQMKKKGYISSTKMVLHDVEEEEKEHMLKYHSEKLAVAFGILNVPTARPVKVIKNLRVCQDCHSAIKYISKITGRLIILRDNNRFHHFDGGKCSCGDYW